MWYFPWGKAATDLLSAAEIKNAWTYTSTPSDVSVALCLIERKDNFTFALPSTRLS
jgi:hypothetical protein